MHIRSFAILTLTLAMWSSAAEPVNVEQLLQELGKARAQLSQQTKPTTSQLLRELSKLDRAIQDGDIAGIQGAISTIVTAPDVPASVAETLERVQRDIPQLIIQGQDRFIAEVDRLAEKAREQILASTTEEQLRPLLRDADSLRLRRPGGASTLVDRALRKVDALQKQVQIWMNISQAKAAGNSAHAVQILQGLMANAQDFPLIPFPEIKKQIVGISPSALGEGEKAAVDPVALLRRVQSLDDVPTVAAEIAAIPQDPMTNVPEINSLKRWANTLHAATVALRSGDIGEAWRRNPELIPDLSQSWVPEALRVRELLMADLLPKYLQLPPGKQRRPEESPADHLQRLTREAAAEKRWDEVSRLLRIANNSYRAPDFAYEQTNSIQNYLEGQGFEAAGEIARAASSYRLALRGTGPLSPVADASARLKALQAEHPELLEEARKQMEENRVLGLAQQAETLLSTLSRRVEALEATTRGTPAGRPSAAVPANDPSLVPRFTNLEEETKRLGELTKKLNTLPDRLARIETMLGSALENVPATAEGSVKLWLGPDYTVYRTALPPALDKGLTWQVRFNGKIVLGRHAGREMQYRYFGVKPGNYSIELTLGEKRVSNVIDYTLTPEVAKTLKRIEDDDLDRDGVPNASEGN